MPAAAIDAASAAVRDVGVRGVAAIEGLLATQASARARAATLLGGAPRDVAFTESTSASMHWLACMADQDRAGRDEVVLLADEFPSSTLAWLRAGFRPRWVTPEPGGIYPVEKILDDAGPRTRAVVTSQVQYRTGAVTDVGALGAPLAARGVWHVVNATQAAGVLPQDASTWGCAAICVTGLKWLCAGLGNGILYLAPRIRDEARPPALGWLSMRDPFAMDNSRLDPRDDASVLELGAVGLARHAALDASLSLMMGLGLARVGARARSLAGRRRDGRAARGADVVTPADPARRAGIVTARRAGAAAWHERALARGLVHSLRGADGLRFSLHHYNREDDVDALLSAWDEIR